MPKRKPMKCQHTPCPEGYLQWRNWAEKKSKTHKQIQCPVCKLFAVWVRKDGKPDPRFG